MAEITLAKRLQQPLNTRVYQFDAPNMLQRWTDLADLCTRGGKQIEHVTGQLRIAEFWLLHLIEELEIDVHVTAAKVRAVDAEAGSSRTLATVKLRQSLETIRAAIEQSSSPPEASVA